MGVEWRGGEGDYQSVLGGRGGGGGWVQLVLGVTCIFSLDRHFNGMQRMGLSKAEHQGQGQGSGEGFT